MTSELSLVNFSLRYTPSAPWALSGVTLQIPTGACCAVLGAVSSGKSTLLQTISGLLGKHHATAETQGEFILARHEGTPIPREVLFPEIGLVLQDPYVMISSIQDTVAAEVAFTGQNLGLEPNEMHARVQNILTSLQLQELANRHPRHLSGGEMQRVALASVLVAKPKLLLLDEPCTALDSPGQDALARILRDLRGRATVIFSDYDLNLAMAVADYLVVLEQGKCIYSGSKNSFLEHNEKFIPSILSDSWQRVMPKLAQPGYARIRTFLGSSDA